MKKSSIYFILSVLLFALFGLFTYLVMTVDVQAVGPQGSSVGFATFNAAFKATHPYNRAYYKLSELFGYAALLTVPFFALFAFMQLTIKKGFSKVDPDLYFLGFFYVAILGTYILFNKIVINYRPVILDEGLEASYPSSHTILAISALGAAICQFSARLKNKIVRVVIISICTVLMLAIIISRTMSGVHWITDIMGAILISMAWVTLYCGIFNVILDNKKANAVKEKDDKKKKKNHKKKKKKKAAE